MLYTDAMKSLNLRLNTGLMMENEITDAEMVDIEPNLHQIDEF